MLLLLAAGCGGPVSVDAVEHSQRSDHVQESTITVPPGDYGHLAGHCFGSLPRRVSAACTGGLELAIEVLPVPDPGSDWACGAWNRSDAPSTLTVIMGCEPP